ncbi:MAG TPA: PilZ domain-containing protein [Terriglobales bacterium]|nr:PilZ domain-containing protein [Terriglobales bacterium]
MVEITNRRQFERLELTERAIAVNDRGVRLGPVTQAGGGGMLVVAADADTLVLMPPGKRMRVTIVEPELGTSNTMDVEVVYQRPDNRVGMQFVTLSNEELS